MLATLSPLPVNMGAKVVEIVLPSGKSAKILKWKVKEGTIVSVGRVILLYDVNVNSGEGEQKKLKANQVGTVRKLVAKEGAIVHPGDVLLELEECTHPTVMKDMCAECGADLRKEETTLLNASVPMTLGRADEKRLLKDRKLVLLVDLDQTLIHTTNDNIPANLKDVYHFQLYGQGSPWYHTRLRPGAQKFLSEMSQIYELHICTFGARNYAHMIAAFLDGDGKFFSHRILSRDECLNPDSKTANLTALFPCGDNLVCIIDDREDVWNFAPNLVHVKPYHFFQHTGDINAPPGLAKCENDDKEGFDFTKMSDIKENKSIKSEVKENGEVKLKHNKPESECEDGELSDDSRLGTGDASNVNVKQKLKIKRTTENIDSDKDTIKDCEIVETTDEKSKDSVEGDLELSDDESRSEVPGTCGSVTESSENKDNKVASVISTNISEVTEDIEDVKEVRDSEGKTSVIKSTEKVTENVTQEVNTLESSSEKVSENVVQEVKTVENSENENENRTDSGDVGGCEIPTHTPLEKSRAYLVARSLGAQITQDLIPESTHLVAVRPGTAKVNSARRIAKNVITVTPDWLWCCAERWERVDERLFPLLKGGAANRHPPAHCGSPEHIPIHQQPAARRRTPSGRFMDTINPLMSFSPEDIANMDREVEDIFNESESEEHPHGWGKSGPTKRKRHAAGTGTESDVEEDDEEEDTPSTKFRRGEALPSDVEFGDDESFGSEEPPDEIDDGDWNMMGAALEREFLSGHDD
ncbi:hypothetical protein C0J52_19241 [Blattella germanica]|nr:hypothetical protein C0J52_19241 [Blattella germanica]